MNLSGALKSGVVVLDLMCWGRRVVVGGREVQMEEIGRRLSILHWNLGHSGR